MALWCSVLRQQALYMQEQGLCAPTSVPVPAAAPAALSCCPSSGKQENPWARAMASSCLGFQIDVLWVAGRSLLVCLVGGIEPKGLW